MTYLCCLFRLEFMLFQEHEFKPKQATEVSNIEPDQGTATVWREITWFTTELNS